MLGLAGVETLVFGGAGAGMEPVAQYFAFGLAVALADGEYLSGKLTFFVFLVFHAASDFAKSGKFLLLETSVVGDLLLSPEPGVLILLCSNAEEKTK